MTPTGPTPPRNRPPRSERRSVGCAIVFSVVAALGVGLLMSPVPGKLKRGILQIIESAKAPAEAPEPPPPEVVERETVRIVERTVEVPVPGDAPEMPDGPVRYRQIEVATLFNGIQIETELQSDPGEAASVERARPDAYTARFELRVRVPEPLVTLDELAAANPHLPEMLAGAGALFEGVEVSGFYHHLYDLKQRQVQANMTRLEQVLSRHNFYDCDTVLELEHPGSGRKIFFLQAEMDVVSDGSDGDRMADFDEYVASSTHFQPTTSYGWPKQTGTPNPLVKVLEGKLREHKERYKVRGLPRAENAYLEGQIKAIPKYIDELKSRSFLIAQADPFVVIPLSTRPYVEEGGFVPQIGDYAVVVHEDKLYPAIVGDFGPTTKTGEASLRITQEIDPASDPYRRPVSDLAVSYLIFPGTADKPFRAPDLDHWHARCAELLAEAGGIGEGYELHRWDDPFAVDEPAAETEPAGPEAVPDDSPPDVRDDGGEDPAPGPGAPDGPDGPAAPDEPPAPDGPDGPDEPAAPDGPASPEGEGAAR